jgi:ankyrin repeat protein
MHHAALGTHVDILEALLKRGLDPNDRTFKGLTPLHLAVHSSSTECLRFLAANGADVSLTDESGRSALTVAIVGGNMVMAEELRMAYGLDPAELNSQGMNSLHFAAIGGSLEAAKWCAEHGCAPALQTKAGWAALHYASARGHVEVVQWLLEDQKVPHSPVDETGVSPLHLAATGPSEAVLIALLRAGADPSRKDGRGNTPITLATMRPSSGTGAVAGTSDSAVALLKEALAPPRAPEAPKITLARPSVLRVEFETPVSGPTVPPVDGFQVQRASKGVLGLGSWVDVDGGDGLPASSQQLDIHFLKPDAPVAARVRAHNRNGWGPWSSPSREVTLAQVTKEVLGEPLAASQPALPSRVSSGGEDAPSVAVAAARATLAGDVAALIEVAKSTDVLQSVLAPVGPEESDQLQSHAGQGRTLLHIACAEGQSGIASFLCQTAEQTMGPQRAFTVMELRDKRGATPLLLAVVGGFLPICRMLKSQGAEVDVSDLKGFSALHYAAHKGHARVFRWLLEAGADPDARTLNGKTVESMASSLRVATAMLSSARAPPPAPPTPVFLGASRFEIAIQLLPLRLAPGCPHPLEMEVSYSPKFSFLASAMTMTAPYPTKRTRGARSASLENPEDLFSPVEVDTAQQEDNDRVVLVALTPDTTYVIRARARTVRGWGSWSASSLEASTLPASDLRALPRASDAADDRRMTSPMPESEPTFASLSELCSSGQLVEVVDGLLRSDAADLANEIEAFVDAGKGILPSLAAGLKLPVSTGALYRRTKSLLRSARTRLFEAAQASLSPPGAAPVATTSTARALMKGSERPLLQGTAPPTDEETALVALISGVASHGLVHVLMWMLGLRPRDVVGSLPELAGATSDSEGDSTLVNFGASEVGDVLTRAGSRATLTDLVSGDAPDLVAARASGPQRSVRRLSARVERASAIVRLLDLFLMRTSGASRFSTFLASTAQLSCPHAASGQAMASSLTCVLVLALSAECALPSRTVQRAMIGAFGDVVDHDSSVVDDADDLDVEREIASITSVLNNAADSNGVGGVHRAACSGCESVLRALACAQGKASEVALQVLDRHGATPLHYAATTNQAAVMGWFLSSRCGDTSPQDALDRSPVHYGALGGGAGSVACLCEGLWLTAGEGVDRWRILASELAKQDAFGITPLHAAIASNNAACVSLILSIIASASSEAPVPAVHRALNARDERARTPLSMAAAAGSDAVVSVVRAWCQPPPAPTRPKVTERDGLRVTLECWQLVPEGTAEIAMSALEAAIDGATSISASMGHDVAASESRWRHIASFNAPSIRHTVRIRSSRHRAMAHFEHGERASSVTLGEDSEHNHTPPLPITLVFEDVSSKGDDEEGGPLRRSLRAECPVVGWTRGLRVEIRSQNANGEGPWSPESELIDELK